MHCIGVPAEPLAITVIPYNILVATTTVDQGTAITCYCMLLLARWFCGFSMSLVALIMHAEAIDIT